MEEDVLLEYIDDEDMDKVAVIPYDRFGRQIEGNILEVTERAYAIRNYNVVGYIIDGEISVNEDDGDEEPDYYKEFGIEDDD